jgi:hypothetical protein
MTVEMITFRCRNVDPFGQQWREIVELGVEIWLFPYLDENN